MVWTLVSQRVLSNLQYVLCVEMNKIPGTWQVLILASLKPVSTKDRQAGNCSDIHVVQFMMIP